MPKIGIGKSNYAILTGAEDLKEWSDEELIRGMRRAKDGKWNGRPPRIVPKAVHDELMSRRLKQAHDLMREDIVAAVKLLGDCVRDEAADYSDRLKAAGMIIDRVLPKEIKVEVEAPWLTSLKGAIVSIEESNIIDVEVEDEDGPAD